MKEPGRPEIEHDESRSHRLAEDEEGPRTSQPQRPRQAWVFGMILVAVSVVLPAAALVMPFLPLSVGWKVGAISALLVAGEVAFWAAALVLGREAVRRYRRFLDPRYWFEKRRL